MRLAKVIAAMAAFKKTLVQNMLEHVGRLGQPSSIWNGQKGSEKEM
jgi:hypothetical protein